MVAQRKLATIMSVDVAGYSRAAELDDGAAAEAVGTLRRAIEDVIAPFDGRIFNSAGDGFMIEFPVASSGAQAALKLLSESNAGVRPMPKIRIGLHLGEVIAGENGDLLGHGVNVAARLQALAAPGEAIVSGAVQSQLRKAAGVPLTPRGRVQLAKMNERIEVFALAPEQQEVPWRDWRRFAKPLAAALAVIVLGLGGWFGWHAFGAQGGALIGRPAQRIAFSGLHRWARIRLPRTSPRRRPMRRSRLFWPCALKPRRVRRHKASRFRSSQQEHPNLARSMP